MVPGKYDDLAAKRLAHVQAHLNLGFKIEQLIRNIEGNLGNPTACLMALSRHAAGKAIHSWFASRDLMALRQWSYVAARLDQLSFPKQDRADMAAANTLQLLYPLLSNHAGLIHWFSHFDAGYDSSRIENPKLHDFWAYQSILALRGEWERLQARCELILANPPLGGAEKNYVVDHRFFLSLAQGNLDGMQRALTSILDPKLVRARNDDDSGYAADLISTAGVIFAKIAWLHGHQVKVDSNYVPNEWLPAVPLDHYEDVYSFMAA